MRNLIDEESVMGEESVASLLLQANKCLAEAGVPSAEADARQLAEHVLGTRLYLAPRRFSPPQRRQFTQLIRQRAQRVPLQHLTGKMWFRFLELKSAPGTFIVRPETELVAGAAIAQVKRLQQAGEKDPLVLDLCTGSGAIALAVATETDCVNVHAVELSRSAMLTAQENNAKYGGPVDFRFGDALGEFAEYMGKVAVVVANPPYVPPHHKLAPEVKADPELALFGGGPDGLNFPRSLISRAYELLRDGGLLVMEHADEQGEATCEIARNVGFASAQTKTDLAGKPRYLEAWKRHHNAKTHC